MDAQGHFRTGRSLPTVTNASPWAGVEAGTLVEIGAPGWQDDGLYVLRLDGCHPRQTPFVYDVTGREKDGSLRRFVSLGGAALDRGLRAPSRCTTEPHRLK